MSATHVNMLDRCSLAPRQTGSPPPGLFGSGCDMVTHSSIWSSDWVTQGKHDTKQYITRSFKTFRHFETDDHEMIFGETSASLSAVHTEADTLRISPLTFWQFNQAGTCSIGEIVETSKTET